MNKAGFYKEKILILVLSGFGAGIAIRSFFELGWPEAGLAGLLGAGFLVLKRLRPASNDMWFAAAAIFLLAFSFGILRYDLKDQKTISSDLALQIDKQVGVRGLIVDEPDERENGTRLVIESNEFLDWQSKEWQDVSDDRILIFAPRYPGFKYGDIVEVRGKLQEPKNFIDDFSWEDYLAKDDIFLQIFYPEIKKTGEGGGSPIKRILFGIKNKYLESLGRVMSEPHAALAGGLTVGAKRAMPKELLDDFRKTGVIHIVVLSGYNITIIAKAIASFFSLFMPWLAGIITGMIGIVMFAILAGGSATVVRASVMAILIYIAHMTGNVYRVTIALFIAGFFMLMQNPKLLRFDASFQLSFLATLGLIFISPKIEKYLRFIPKKFNLREVAGATISAQIAVTPFILHNMGTFSLVSLPVNILILATVPVAMFFSALAGVAGWASPILAMPLAWVAYALLEYELKIVEFFAGWGLAEITWEQFQLVVVIIMYVLIIWAVVIKRPAVKTKELSIIE
ncbi:MAG: ComEC/Rec2 family competence protein, partial [Patescibacteria group bacterium]